MLIKLAKLQLASIYRGSRSPKIWRKRVSNTVWYGRGGQTSHGYLAGFMHRVATKSGKSGNFIFNQGKSEENERYFRKSGKIKESFMFLILSFQSSDFLHTQPCIQLNVTVAKIHPFVCQSGLRGHFEVQFRFVIRPKIEQPKTGPRLSDTPYLPNEMIKNEYAL